VDSPGFLVGLGKAGHLGFSPGICSGGVLSAGLYDAGPGHRGVIFINQWKKQYYLKVNFEKPIQFGFVSQN